MRPRPRAPRPPDDWPLLTDEGLTSQLARRAGASAPPDLAARIAARVSGTPRDRVRWLSRPTSPGRLALPVLTAAAVMVLIGSLVLSRAPVPSPDSSPRPGGGAIIWDPSQRPLTTGELAELLATRGSELAGRLVVVAGTIYSSPKAGVCPSAGCGSTLAGTNVTIRGSGMEAMLATDPRRTAIFAARIRDASSVEYIDTVALPDHGFSWTVGALRADTTLRIFYAHVVSAWLVGSAGGGCVPSAGPSGASVMHSAWLTDSAVALDGTGGTPSCPGDGLRVQDDAAATFGPSGAALAPGTPHRGTFLVDVGDGRPLPFCPTNEACIPFIDRSLGQIIGRLDPIELPPSPTASPAVSPTPAMAATASPSPLVPTQPPAERTSVWSRVALPTVPGSTTVITGFPGIRGGPNPLPGGGFIDFIPVAADHAIVLTSADGSHWSQTGSVTGSGASGISGPVANDGRLYVALGGEWGGLGSYASPTNGAAWVSSDLRHWAKAPAQAAFAATELAGLAAGAGRFVAVGYQRNGRSMWTSTDGFHWTALTDDHLFPVESTEITGISFTGRGFVAVGRIGQAAAAWTSTDGASWSLHSPLGDGTAVELVGLATGASGFVSLGTGLPVEVGPGDTRSAVAGWTAADGTTWRGGPVSPALFGAYGSLVAVPGGYAAAAMVGSGPSASLWTSRDGLEWVPVAGVDLNGLDSIGLVSDGRRALLIGTGPSGPKLWVSDGLQP